MVNKNSIIDTNPRVKHVHGELQTLCLNTIDIPSLHTDHGKINYLCTSRCSEQSLLHQSHSNLYILYHHYLLMKNVYPLPTMIMSVILLALGIHSPSISLRYESTTDHNTLYWSLAIIVLWKIPLYCLWGFLLLWSKGRWFTVNYM